VSLFTSSSKKKKSPWARFFKFQLQWLLYLTGGIFLLIIIVDPFDTLPLSPDLPRVPIANNARFSFPMLAKSDSFNSAIIGTSTTRLLKPSQLNNLFNASFANFSMDAARSYEQSKIFAIFNKKHTDIKVVIFGIDVIWLSPRARDKYNPLHAFPEWMYDDNPWNDYLHQFNLMGIEEAGRQAATLLGLRPVKYGLDGHTNFLPDIGNYNINKVREKIYGTKNYQSIRQNLLNKRKDKRFKQNLQKGKNSLTFPDHPLLADMLSSLPLKTVKIGFIVPHHIAKQPNPGSSDMEVLEEGKRRITKLFASVPNGKVIDFMIDSPLTREDSNYWDSIHYTLTVAEKLPNMLYKATIFGEKSCEYKILLN